MVEYITFIVLIVFGVCFLFVYIKNNRRTMSDEQIQGITDKIVTDLATAQNKTIEVNTDTFASQTETRLKAQTEIQDEKLKLRVSEIEKVISDFKTTWQADMNKVNTEVLNLTGIMKQSQDISGNLAKALGSAPTRGQWGERQAEDVLRFAGMIPEINYHTQTQLENGARPDFTFDLPGGKVVHMDSKFPMTNYLKYMESDNDLEQKEYLGQFLSDVKVSIRSILDRGYIDPATGNVDTVLLYVPNEQISSFIHQKDSSILEYALENRVLLCSPFNLLAILQVIRQAVQNLNLTQQASEILMALEGFSQEWERYLKATNKLGTDLQRAQKTFDTLTTTRTNQMQRKIDKVQDLRTSQLIEPSTQELLEN